jgi:hypothetical protein
LHLPERLASISALGLRLPLGLSGLRPGEPLPSLVNELPKVAMHCGLIRLASAVHRLASRAAVLPVAYSLGSGQVLRYVEQPPNPTLHADSPTASR